MSKKEMHGKANLKLRIINRSRLRVPRRFLVGWMRELERLAAEEIDPRRYRGLELLLVFLNEPEARELNKSFRGKAYATDVLSFEAIENSSLGELVICPEVIARQAQEHQISVRAELGYMILHGFLHLLGYEHETNARDAKKMLDLQDRLFDQLLSKTKLTKTSSRQRPKSSRRDLSKPVRPQSKLKLDKTTDSHAKTSPSPRFARKTRSRT